MNAPRPLFRCTFCHRIAERAFSQCSACGAESSYVPAPPDVTRPAGNLPGFPSPHGAFPQAPAAWPVPYGARHPGSYPHPPRPFGLIQGGLPGAPYGGPQGNFRMFGAPAPVKPVPLGSIEVSPTPRRKLFGPLDYVLGGNDEADMGVACGTTVQLAGAPGAGKSTILLQALAAAAEIGPVLYSVAEESGDAIHRRAMRLNVSKEILDSRLFFQATDVIEDFWDYCRAIRPVVAVFDSLQHARSRIHMHPARSASMVVYAADGSFKLAQDPNLGGLIVILICQIVKDMSAAGPKATEHAIDAMAYLDTQQGSDMRTLSSTKNRNGPGMRQALLTMTPLGLVPWEDKHPDRVATCKDGARDGAQEPPAPETVDHGPTVLPEQRTEERPGDLHHEDRPE